MNVCLCRVDDRLIHGQITAAWIREFGITNVYIVDDELAEDRLATKVIGLTIPPQIGLQVLSVPQMADLIQVADTEWNPARAMILFRDLNMAGKLFLCSGRFANQLVLGGTTARLGRVEVRKGLFLSEEEIDAILQLEDQVGIAVQFQLLPGAEPINVKELLTERL